ncbi:MAG: NADH-quinone oxidoreductase subunit C [Betaproteobacteria bacterium]|nr:NADH-quinone oxidoreductase subunit C [Betaproteobacteria bacterium]
MKLSDLDIRLEPLPAAFPAWRADVSEWQWISAHQAVREEGGYLVALWGADERSRGRGFAVHGALATPAGLLCLVLRLPPVAPAFPDVSEIFPAAIRMQRAVHDLLGIEPKGAEDQRPWLRHGAWPADQYPLRKDFILNPSLAPEPDEYRFVAVAGDGVHEIPVGPVHAGTIEPGHFRFSIVGEKVLRLEERLGYTHKGIEKRFEAMDLLEGAKLAGRVSGDSTVAYAWAYAMAAEAMTGITPPPRALWLRALFLERERVANHLGDLGFLGNDAALSFGLAQFSRLKEDWLRTHHALFGHRYLMDLIVPGGVARDIDSGGTARIRDEIAFVRREVEIIKEIYDEHAGLQDRFITTGRVTPALAAKLGLTGLAGRASGQAWDRRVEFPAAPYDQLEVQMVTHRNGDVAARVTVRFEETLESLRLIGEILDRLPAGGIATTLGVAPEGALGLGWVEGWRGEVLVALHAGANNAIGRCHAHDPSWQNWPLLEHAVIGNIVPDFPLINKSFNLSYSGQDL